MDKIQYSGILPDKSYNGIRALAEFSVCINKYQHWSTPSVSTEGRGSSLAQSAEKFHVHQRYRGRDIQSTTKSNRNKGVEEFF
jgi:hypothetical protein